MPEHAHIDISNVPELLRLAEEVKRSGRSQVLSCKNEEIAVLSPARPNRRRGNAVTKADIEATLAAFGGWKDLIDPEEFKTESG